MTSGERCHHWGSVSGIERTAGRGSLHPRKPMNGNTAPPLVIPQSRDLQFSGPLLVTSFPDLTQTLSPVHKRMPTRRTFLTSRRERTAPLRRSVDVATACERRVRSPCGCWPEVESYQGFPWFLMMGSIRQTRPVLTLRQPTQFLKQIILPCLAATTIDGNIVTGALHGQLVMISQARSSSTSSIAEVSTTNPRAWRSKRRL
jgi:hypothetical protein